MKALDSFTVERLEEIRNSFLDRIQETAPSIEEVFALIDIALAAKRADPDYYIVRLKFNDGWGDETVLDTYETKLDASKSKDDHGGEIIPIYTTPHFNQTELPDAVNEFLAVLDNYPEQLVPINRNSVPVKDLRKALSSDLQLNSPEIPDGWKLTPINPTEEMVTRAWREAIGRIDHGTIRRIYLEMLAAAPEKPL